MIPKPLPKNYLTKRDLEKAIELILHCVEQLLQEFGEEKDSINDLLKRKKRAIETIKNFRTKQKGIVDYKVLINEGRK